MILAFVGAVQLKQFGAQIYVADLVGIAMIREMGAMMTGIIMAGRTGAAFAAQLGTMKGDSGDRCLHNHGFFAAGISCAAKGDCARADDAFALSLCGFRRRPWRRRDRCGYVGSFLDHVFSRDLERYRPGGRFWGVFKSSVYGVLIALAGCLRGIQCGNSSSAVGDAATSAVVTGIVAIVMACGIFAVVFYVLGI